MLNKKVRAQILFNKLDNLLKSKGYTFNNRLGAPEYIYKDEKSKVFLLYANFNSSGSVYVSGLLLSLNEVENLILEIGNERLPSIILETYQNEENFLPTVKDIVFDNEFKEKYYLKAPETEAEMETMANWVVNYLETRGFAFAEHYSYLPNILAKMDMLDTEGIPWHKREKGILGGTLDGYFRGLIISKLCGDKNYEKKIKRMDKKFNQEIYVEWLPYYEKLKERLQTITPKYDASTGSVFKEDNIT